MSSRAVDLDLDNNNGGGGCGDCCCCCCCDDDENGLRRLFFLVTAIRPQPPPPPEQSSGSDCTSLYSSLRLRRCAGLLYLRRDAFGDVTGDVAGENVWKRLMIDPNMMMTATCRTTAAAHPTRPFFFKTFIIYLNLFTALDDRRAREDTKNARNTDGDTVIIFRIERRK